MEAAPHSFIDGAPIPADGELLTLINPFTMGSVCAITDVSPVVVDLAARNANRAFLRNRDRSVAERARWLENCADTLSAHVDEIVELLVSDIGKPRRSATFEVRRSVAFVRLCAAQILSLECTVPVLDATDAGHGHMGFTNRVPYGVVAAITPFNAPVNLLIQKVVPALAAGNAVVVKPHPAGTRAALKIAELFAAAGLPPGLLNVVTGDRGPATALVRHPLVRAVTFTGGSPAGNALVRAAGAKKFVAELGSNAANIVLADADLKDAARSIARAAFEASGQQCISAQRVIVERCAMDTFLQAFVSAASELVVGDPGLETTDVGPMVSVAAADRVEKMLADTISKGSRYALTPRRENCVISPAIIVNAEFDTPLWQDEVFGPAVTVHAAESPSHALSMANDSPFGLQGALFTASLDCALAFAKSFDVGSLWINEPSRFRLDTVPFGGVKDSGYGREGVRYAIEEMSQLKFVGIRVRATM
ncbi:aldehyde dehydrogenase family protein [Paraburkholderia caffeinilytica]|uniref:aldehyde dehydrogenase family protein n=1 Tax=Paraburkholderia caffeinilytica TaxID=1761016 RepID=UPI0038BA74B8